MSDHSVLDRWNRAISRASGRKSRVVGTRYTMKTKVVAASASANRRRASAYAASRASRTERTAVTDVTNMDLRNHSGKAVYVNRKLYIFHVMPAELRKGFCARSES